MRKVSGKLLVTIILLLSIVMCLIGCSDGSTGGDTTDPSVTVTDDFYTDGYNKGSVTTENIYTDLMGSLANTIDIIGDDVSSSSPTASATATINIDLNGEAYVAQFKLNINLENQEKVQYTLELYSGSSVVFALYSYMDSDTITNYVQLGDSKFCWEDKYVDSDIVFPLTFDTSTLDGYATLMSSIIMMDTSSVKYEYKSIGTRMERHYYFSLDMNTTINKLISLSSFLTADELAMYDLLLINLLGVDFEDIESGNVPDTKLSIEFTTSDGYNSSLGWGVISQLKMELDVAATDEEDTMFNGEAYSASFDVASLVISAETISNYKKQSALTGYVDLLAAEFSYNATLIYENSDAEYALTGYLKTNFDENLEDQFYLKVADPETDEILTTILISNGELSFSTMLDGVMEEVAFDFDFVAFMSSVESLINSSNNYEFSAMNSLIYVLASLNTNSSGNITYTFMEDYFDKLFGLSTLETAQMIGDCSSEDIIALCDAQGIDLEGLLKMGFSVSVDNTDVYLTVKEIS
ncbi:MAG: hypothetical protein R3Y23_03405 [Bacillota bacterium]